MIATATLQRTTAAVAPRCRWLGRRAYAPVWHAMQRFTEERDAGTADEIWLLEHEPVFTLGLGADASHVLAPGDIAVMRIDRGGQVTYHGPGQLVVYVLIDLRRAALGVRALVSALEQSVIACAAGYGIRAETHAGAPGVYVQQLKLASVGLRVRRGGSYHGLALNVNMDLAPFGRINPCGYAGLQMTQLAELGGPSDVCQAARALAPMLAARLGLAAVRYDWDAGALLGDAGTGTGA
ncbi:MAG: lipoyl(octanoyl) transferase LipB [Steroidobacteraceae bacterium]